MNRAQREARNERILNAWAAGKRGSRIAIEEGISDGLVYMVIGNARQAGDTRAVPRDTNSVHQIHIDLLPPIMAKLRQEALKRHVTVRHLITELIEYIANDNLVDAVMDDKETSDA